MTMDRRGAADLPRRPARRRPHGAVPALAVAVALLVSVTAQRPARAADGVQAADGGGAAVPGEIVRDCRLGERLRLAWRPGDDPRATRHEIFSRPVDGGPADWHGFTPIDAAPLYTFDDARFAGREFRIALKDAADGSLRGWSGWQKPACAPGTAPGQASATARGALPLVVASRVDANFLRLDWSANPDAPRGVVDIGYHDASGARRMYARDRRGGSWIDATRTLCPSTCPSRNVPTPLGTVALAGSETLFELIWRAGEERRSTWIVVDRTRRVQLVGGTRPAGASAPGGGGAGGGASGAVGEMTGGATRPDGAGTSDVAARRECAGDGTTRIVWQALSGARRYDLFRRDPGGSVWLRGVPAGQTSAVFAAGTLAESDEIQVDTELLDGSRRYGRDGINGCPNPSPRSAPPSAGGAGLPPFIADAPSGWTLHPWSHDFDRASDLDRWYAPHRLGGRDPDDRHVGKQRQARPGGPLTDNSADFAEIARVDTAAGHLVMRSVFSSRDEDASRGLQRGEARMPFLISAATFDTLDRDGRRLGWTQRYPYPCGEATGTSVATPCDFLIDPRERDWYIEIRASFAGATEAFKSWWAFWLYPRTDAYDGNVDTGMEVDVLEYVPYVERDGFHTALFRRRGETLRPDGRAFTARDTDAFLRGANADYDACRRQDACPPIRLDEGFHTIGIAYSRTGYAFYLDGYRYWEVRDPAWVTKTPRLALQLTWEKDEGSVIEDNDGNGRLDYLDDGVGGVARDGVPDWRQSPKRSGLSYGPWGQGFANPRLYDLDCLTRVVSGPKRARFTGQYTFEVARGRYGIAASDLEIVEGSCSLNRHATAHQASEVRIDHVRVYTRARP